MARVLPMWKPPPTKPVTIWIDLVSPSNSPSKSPANSPTNSSATPISPTYSLTDNEDKDWEEEVNSARPRRRSTRPRLSSAEASSRYRKRVKERVKLAVTGLQQIIAAVEENTHDLRAFLLPRLREVLGNIQITESQKEC